MKADSLSVPRHREEESLSIYPYTYQQMWFQGSVDCPSPAARGGETNDVPAWAGTYQPTIPSLPLRDLEVERGFDLLFLSSPFPVGSTRWVDPS